MKKTAALALAVVALALTGCTATSAAPAATVVAQPAAVAAEPTSIYEAVWREWDGDRPDEAWIDTAAMLACKQILGGHEPRVVMDHEANNELVVSAAEDYLCETDRAASDDTIIGHVHGPSVGELAESGDLP